MNFRNRHWIVKTVMVLLSLTALAGLVSAGCAAVRGGYESAPYRVVKRDGKFEVRDYPSLVVAETSMRGADGSFMRLFRFIDGKNAEEKKIPMTTPVFISGRDTNMTMAFVMPEKMTANLTPKPAEPGVTIRELTGGTFAVLRFSGGRNAASEEQHLETLRAWMSNQKLTPEGGPIFAYFDPPWTPTFFRRNEVMLRIAP